MKNLNYFLNYNTHNTLGNNVTTNNESLINQRWALIKYKPLNFFYYLLYTRPKTSNFNYKIISYFIWFDYGF